MLTKPLRSARLWIVVAASLLLAVAAQTAAAQSTARRRLPDDGDEAFSRGDHARRADIFVLQKKYQARLDWVTGTTLEQRPGEPAILARHASLRFDLGRESEDIRRAEQLVQRDPSAHALHIIGEHHFEQGAPGADAVVSACGRRWNVDRPELRGLATAPRVR